MLKKLFKQEILSTYKILGSVNLLLLLIALALSLAVPDLSLAAEGEEASAALLLTVLLLVVLESIVSYTTAILLAIRYYKSMYGREAYLTHTLPVTAGQLLCSKILAYLFWCLVNCIPIAAAGFAILRSLQPLMLFRAILAAAAEALAIPASGLLLLGAAVTLTAMLSGASLTFGCINIGGQFGKQRILAAVISYAIFYILIQFGLSALSTLFSLGVIRDDFISGGAEILRFSVSLLVLWNLLNLLFFWLSWFLSSKRLNL